MILILKYDNNTTTLFDHGALPAPGLIDIIQIDTLKEGDFPIFNIESESAGVTNERKAGEWGGTISFLQTETSGNSDTINEFFRGGTRDYRYVILMEIGGTVFHGKFNSSSINYDFTYSEGKYELSFLAKDLIEDWALYLDTQNSYFDIPLYTTLQFEDYITNHHLENFNINFTGDTLSTRVGTNTFFDGNAYQSTQAVTDMHGVSRLETFKGLAQGLGFTYDLSLSMTLTDILNQPSQRYPISFMQVNIGWVYPYSSGATAITQSKIHRERSLPKSTRYLFIGYRHIISTGFPEVGEVDFTAVRGILYDGENIIAESDSADNFNPVYAEYPFFYFFPSGAVSPDGNLIEVHQFAFYDRRYPYPQVPPIYEYADVTFLDLDLYSGGIGFTATGSNSYARLFTTLFQQPGGFLPIQRFVVGQYKRYLQTAGKKVKTVEIMINSDTELRLFKLMSLTDDQGEGFYYISKIVNLNYKLRTVELELTQI